MTSTRFSVKLSNILGLSFYRYELTSSTYNATIDTAFTVTVKVTDIFGNPINNKPITLYHDGTSVSSQNTLSDGTATWNITPTTWGIHDFNVSNQHIQVNVDGWRVVAEDLNGSYAFLRNKTHGRWILRGWTYGYSKSTTWENFGTGNYGASIRPNATVVMISSSANAYFYVDGSGNTKWRAISGSISANTAQYGSCEWAIRDEDL